jgi:hypothetical protein
MLRSVLEYAFGYPATVAQEPLPYAQINIHCCSSTLLELRDDPKLVWTPTSA